jgi:exodeoxyribonuclease VIII
MTIRKTTAESLGHVMLDLETMGKRSNSALISLGAVEFNIDTGEIGDKFYSRIDLQSCLNVGLTVNGDTIYWWLTQNEKARHEIAKGGSPLQKVLFDFELWYSKLGDNIQIWGNGARFDIGLLEDAYVACGYQNMPWYFRGERDLRTLVAKAPEIKERVLNEFNGVKHHPIDDAKIQIKYASEIWNLKNKNHGTKT